MSVPVLGPWSFSQRNEGSVVVPGVVDSSRLLLNDDSFCIPRAAAYCWIHIVLTIMTVRQPSFTILKHLTADISGKDVAPTLLNCRQQVFSSL